jgi:hypothetical protein
VADDPARWSDDDFLIARKLGHPRLCEGLRARAARRADDPGFVEFLVAVLTAPGGAKARSQELASTVAGLLAEHGTPASRKALARLLSGRLTTDDDRAAVSAVLSALAKHPTAEHEAMLLHVLTKAPQVRPDPSGQVTAAALQQQAYALLQQQGSPRLRLQLAQWMADPATPKAVADKFGPVIKEPKRANLEAQALLWERDGLDAAARLAVEQRLAAYSAEAAGWISGRRRAAADDEPDWLARVARTLWREEFGAAVRERLRAAHSLKEARGAFWLAASLPTAAARADLQRVLRRQWEAGPAALGADGSSPQPPPDPGFLLALKRAAQDIRDDARRSGARVSMPAPALGREEMKKRIERQAELARAWLESRDAWLRAVCRDLESAGRAQSAAARRGGQTPPGQRALEACGLAPYPDTTVDAAYYLDWREAVRAGLSSAEGDPLVVAYVRSEARGRLLKVAMHYQRQLKGFRQWAVPGGLWLDALEGNEADGVFCSVDVLVTEAHPGSGKLPNEEQDLWVEVLTVRGSSLRGPGDYAATPGP